MGKKILTVLIGKKISWAMIEYPSNIHEMTVFKATQYPMTALRGLFGGRKNLPIMQGLNLSQIAWNDMQQVDPFTGEHEGTVRVIWLDPNWNTGNHHLNKLPKEQSLAIEEAMVWKLKAEMYANLIDEIDEALKKNYGDFAFKEAINLVHKGKEIRKASFTYNQPQFGGGN